VTFPTAIASHSAEQVFYFNEAGLLQRHDYAAEIIGNVPSANYASHPQDFGGLIVPTRRRVYARDAENKPVLSRLAVSIDIHDISVS